MSERRQRRSKNDNGPEESSPYDSTTVGVYRTAATVKGGRRFSFSALAVVGDRKGTIGYGYGKASEVPTAIEKAEKYARRDVAKVALKDGTIPHVTLGRFGAANVKLVPASPGTGVIAGGTVRAVLELAGVRDCLTKAYGSTNQKNLVKATVNALSKLRRREEISRLRGVELEETAVDEMVKRGQAFMPEVNPDAVKAVAPTNTAGDKKGDKRGRGGRGGGGGGGGGGRGRGGGGGGRSQGATTNAPPTDAPPAAAAKPTDAGDK